MSSGGCGSFRAFTTAICGGRLLPYASLLDPLFTTSEAQIVVYEF